MGVVVGKSSTVVGKSSSGNPRGGEGGEKLSSLLRVMPAFSTHIQLKLFARALRKRTFLWKTEKVDEGRKLEKEKQEGNEERRLKCVFTKGECMHPLGTDSMGDIYPLLTVYGPPDHQSKPSTHMPV